MSKLKLILILLFVAILGALSGAVYYASTLVSPDEVRRLTLEKLQETFPNSKINLGEIDFSMGPTFKFDLEKLIVHADQNEPEKLFAVEDVHVKVPVWAILFGGGEIDVRIQSPELYYISVNKTNNWSKALRTEKKDEKNEGKDKGSKQSGSAGAAVVIPGFLAKSQLNLRVSDLKVKYQDQDKDQNSEFEVSKFLIRNLNFESSTAFELDSNLSFQAGPSQNIQFETLVIGQFNLGTFIREKKLPIMAVVKINNLKAPMLSKSINEIKTDINLLVQNGGVTGGADLRLLRDVRLSADFMTSDSKTGLSNLDINIPLAEVVDLLNIEMAGIDFEKSTLSARGEVDILKGGKIVPNVELEVAPGITQTLMKEKISHQVEASLVNKGFESKLTSKLLSGTMIAKTSAQIDLNEEFSVESLPSFSSEVNLTNISVSKDFIQALLYSKEEPPRSKTPEAPSAKGSGSEEQAPLMIPPGDLVVTLTNIDLGGEILSGKGSFEAQKNFVATKSLEFEYSEGKGNLTHLSKIRPDGLRHQFDFELKKFNLTGAQAFLPPSVGRVSGLFDLDVKGSANAGPSDELPMEFDVVVNALGSKGEAQLLIKLGEKLNELLANVPSLAEKLDSKRPLELDGRFDELAFRSNLTNKKYELNTVKFVGPDARFSLNGKGVVFPPDTNQNSVVNFVYKEEKGNLVDKLRELTGKNELPFKLEGPGYFMKPDYGHTIEVLAKSIVKTQGQKLIEKETKKIKSKLKDELEKKGKDKLKNLLGL